MHAAEIAMVETNCKMPQGLKRFSVTMPNFDLLAPIDKYYHEVALREWTWTHHKDSILASMVFHYEFGQDGQKEQNEEKIDSNIVLSVIAAREELKQSPARQIELLGSMDQLQRQFFHSESAEGVFDCSLQAILDLMESEYGFIGETKHNDDGTMYLQTRALTNIAWNKPTRQFFDENIEQGLKFSNLNSFFGSVMITGKPVISNKSSNYKRACGLPEGHPPLDHFLGIPFFKPGGEISGMVGISNKAGGYSEKDIEFLEPLTVMCGNLIQAYLQIERNSYLINTLAESVKKRTQELELTNTDLKEANTRVRQNAEMKLEHFACMSHEIRTPLNCIIGK